MDRELPDANARPILGPSGSSVSRERSGVATPEPKKNIQTVSNNRGHIHHVPEPHQHQTQKQRPKNNGPKTRRAAVRRAAVPMLATGARWVLLPTGARDAHPPRIRVLLRLVPRALNGSRHENDAPCGERAGVGFDA